MGTTPVWPDEPFNTAVRGAIARGKGLDELRGAVTETAYRLVLDEEQGDTAQSAERLAFAIGRSL